MDPFPAELWLEVCSHLPPAARRSLSSTHRTLYDIARPLGFAEFTLYTYPNGFHPRRAQLDDALERLRFWTSPRIAPHVRLCFTREVTHLWQRSTSAQKDHSEHVLITAFFERMPHFTGLERLHADGIRFTRTGTINLCGLPALRYLEVSGRTTLIQEHVDPAVTLRVANMKMRLDYPTENAWFSVLSRDTLRELNLPYALALAKSDVTPFPNVRTLRTGGLPDMIHAVQIFSKFPNLRSFSSPYGDTLWNLTPAQELSIFPVLEEYTGTHQNLRIFVQRGTLTRITLVSRPAFTDFITELQGITALPNITFLAVRFRTTARDTFDKAEIEALFTLFPYLTELQLTLTPAEEFSLIPKKNGERLDWQISSFLKIIPLSPLPSTLHSLTLKWEVSIYETEYEPTPPRLPELPDLAGLRAELTAKCPALTYIFLDGSLFLFLWCKTSSVYEAAAYCTSDAKAVREQLERNRVVYR
ncbi:L-aminoadipate-semialdehyde dehydrogenase [Mycena sanguinolenta]|uniref:L-aminoadipate-semialdehyde dehydrogenase n=1 Tax=Mycena sanguinolenta TaxID=230812 RepID=A0A8H6X8L1_9AGAR|nr:L-aminoadipate-semialdehyde dehydrogenase [Mycena sanguinolenta]